jgi:hypothetical protein
LTLEDLKSNHVSAIDNDGAARIVDINFNSFVARSMGYLLDVKSPGDFKTLVSLKGRYTLEGIEGAIIDLPRAHSIFKNVKISSLDKPDAITLEGKPLRDASTEFRLNHLVLPNPRIELLHFYRMQYDGILRDGYGDIDGIVDFLGRYQKEIERDAAESRKKDERTHKAAIRRRLYLETFFSGDKIRLRKRDSMLSDVINKELSYFPYAVAACPLADELDFQIACEDMNDKCQAFAYAQGRRCATNFVYNKDALKNKEMMNRYFNYVSKNKWAQLNLVNFFELDLHSPPDKRARMEFANFKRRITEVKEEFPEKQFILVGAGYQWFVSLESFDFVSTSTTGIDKLAPFSRNREPKIPYWFDENLMYAVPAEDRPEINPKHCHSCAKLTPADFNNSETVKRERKPHRIFDLNLKALGAREAVNSKNIGLYLRKFLQASEFSGYQMMIQSP